MNILIVDDQSIVTQSIRDSVNWDSLFIEQVFTANSAREAKQILGENQVDIMLSDIEMPGESGLELLSWVREEKLPVECVFLTSHADFSYAQEAIRLRGMDYILQPARTSDIEAAVKKAEQKIFRDTKLRNLERDAGVIDQHRVDIFAGYMERVFRSDSFLITPEMMRAVFPDSSEKSLYSCFGFILFGWKCEPSEWPDELLRFTLGNVLGELFSGEGTRDVLLVQLGHDWYFCTVCSDETFSDEICSDRLEKFFQFLESYAKFDVQIRQTGRCTAEGIAPATREIEEDFHKNLRPSAGIIRSSAESAVPGSAAEYPLHLSSWKGWMEESPQMVRSDIRNCFAGIEKRRPLSAEDTGYIWTEYTRVFFSILESRGIDPIQVLQPDFTVKSFMEASSDLSSMNKAMSLAEKIVAEDTAPEDFSQEDFLLTAQRYIADNLHRNFSRADVAGAVNMNEVYFSRVFRQRTGQTFQQYVQNERMNYAKELLKNTQLPISMVASRVGFDNFSYFSKVFRRETGMTPQEFRQQVR